MRIISWNCCWQKDGFTDEKRKEILKLNSDILVVQECKQGDWEKLNYSDRTGHWYGDGKESGGDPNKNLGIGIFCSEKYSIDGSLFRCHDLSNMRYSLPYIIKREDKEILTLFSVWAKGGYKYYHIPILNSLKYFCEKTFNQLVLIGDFNTGSQYGKENDRHYKFIKKELEEKYVLHNCAFCQEWLPTYHKIENGNYNSFLDDHCFSSIPKYYVVSFGLGHSSYWSKHSDHVPIIIDIDDTTFDRIPPRRITIADRKAVANMFRSIPGPIS